MPALYQLLALVLVSLAAATTYEWENGYFQGSCYNSTQDSGWLGTGYVDGFFSQTSQVTLYVEIAQAGLYQLDLRYRSQYGDKGTNLYVNGNYIAGPMLPETQLWKQFSLGKVQLNAGNNSITLNNGWGYYQVDELDVNVPPLPRANFTLGPNVDPLATPGAKSLLAFYQDNWGKKIISGQQDFANNYGWFQQNLNKQPAVYGFDFTYYTPEALANGGSSTDVDDSMQWAAKGGLITFVWHWYSPAGYLDKGCQWWSGFYTDCTSFNLANTLAQAPNGANYTLLLGDIDAIAYQIGRLQAQNISILFRPLHEADGGWFWWGASGPNATVELYQLLFNRLTNYHGLHNIVWEWNSGTTGVTAEWYPGSQYADLVSFDYYTDQSQPPFGQHSVQIPIYNTLTAISGSSKVIAMAENGAIPDVDDALASGANWAYFCTWDGAFLTGGQWNPLSFLQYTFNHPQVITLDKLPGYVAPNGSVAQSALTEPLLGIHEMEFGTLNGPVVKLAGYPGFTGPGYVDGWTSSSFTGTVTLYNVTAGNYSIDIRYRSQYGEKYLYFIVDNGAQLELGFPQNSSWTYAWAGYYALPTAPEVNLTIVDDWGYYQVDHIFVSLAPATAAPTTSSTAAPTTSSAAPTTSSAAPTTSSTPAPSTSSTTRAPTTSSQPKLTTSSSTTKSTTSAPKTTSSTTSAPKSTTSSTKSTTSAPRTSSSTSKSTTSTTRPSSTVQETTRPAPPPPGPPGPPPPHGGGPPPPPPHGGPPPPPPNGPPGPPNGGPPGPPGPHH